MLNMYKNQEQKTDGIQKKQNNKKSRTDGIQKKKSLLQILSLPSLWIDWLY